MATKRNSKTLHASILDAAYFSDFEKAMQLITSNEIDVNECKFHTRAGSLPLFHACLFEFCWKKFILENHPDDSYERTLHGMLDCLRALGAVPYVKKLWRHKHPAHYDFRSSNHFYLSWFNPLDCIWMVLSRISPLSVATMCIGGPDGVVEILARRRSYCEKIASMLVREGVADPEHESNGCVLRILCCVYEVDMVRKLLGAGIGKSLLWVNRGVIKRVLCSSHIFLRADSERLLQVLLDYAPPSLLETMRSDFLLTDLMTNIVAQSSLHDTSEAQVRKFTSLMQIMLCAEVDHSQAALRQPRDEIFVSDPLLQMLLCRREFIVQDEFNQAKFNVFIFSGCSRLLGRDIVQSCILPHVITLGGRAQQELDSLLERVGIQLDFRGCRFYYQCLLRGLVSDPLIIWEFRFLEYVLAAGREEFDRIADEAVSDPEDVFTIMRQRFARQNGVREGAWWPFSGRYLC